MAYVITYESSGDTPRAGGGTTITHRAELTDHDAPALAPAFMPEVCDELPETVRRLAELAERREAGARS